MRFTATLSLSLFAILTSSAAFAGLGPSPTPGPVIGLVAGPWGLVAAGVGYGAYRLLRRQR